MPHLLLGSWGPMDKVHTGNRASETMRLKYHGDARAQMQNRVAHRKYDGLSSAGWTEFPNNREINREFFYGHSKNPHGLRLFAIPMHKNRELTGEFQGGWRIWALQIAVISVFVTRKPMIVKELLSVA